MAEEEKIMAHAKKAVKALARKETKWEERLKDFLLEIFIIVIAVNITLWFHNWNDKRHEEKETKEFLIGIRADLKQDTSNLMQLGIRDFKPTVKFYDSVYYQLVVGRLDSNYIKKNQSFLTNRADFLYDDSRFQSFKSSGDLKLIENQKLQRDITYLYTTEFPVDKSNDAIIFQKRQDDYDHYIGSKVKLALFMDTNGKYSPYQPVFKLFNDPAVQYQIIKYDAVFHELQQMKLNAVKAAAGVIKEIEKELRDRYDYDVDNDREKR